MFASKLSDYCIFASQQTKARLFLQAVYGFVFNTEKPGLCPANDLITTCDCPFPQNSCSNDYECPFGNHLLNFYY